MKTNPLNLPHWPYPGAKLRDTVIGHILLVNIADSHLRKALQEWEDNGCGDGPEDGGTRVKTCTDVTVPVPVSVPKTTERKFPSRNKSWGWERILRIHSAFMFMPDPCGEYGGMKHSPVCMQNQFESQIFN